MGAEDISDLIVAEIPHMRRYARALMRDIDRADDLVQEALTRALKKPEGWRRKGTIRSWLLGILHNSYADHFRKERRHSHMPLLDNVAGMPVQEARQHDIMECKSLLAALDCLAEEQRQTLLLNAVEGLAYDEIAQVMNVPVGTVRSRLARGRALLQDIMNRAGIVLQPIRRVK